MGIWDGFTRDTVTWARVDRGWPSQDRPESFDLEAFRQTYPIVEEVFDAMCREGREKKYPLYACLGDFKGDTLAFYNNVFEDGVHFGDKFYQRYRPWEYDEAAGAPICNAGQWDPNNYHYREWCLEAQSVARLWPLTTPSLHTLYVIDRNIKPRPGARIPPGTKTFQGNGCVFVEVPEPTDPSLESGGVDSFWQYPDGGPWDEHVFSFARYLSEWMEKNRAYVRLLLGPVGQSNSGGNFRNHFKSSGCFIAACTTPGVDSPHNRAIKTDRIPPVKVLAIVD
ncbi:hypothetical protein F5144DRAFT_356763 [Chaetomium tenue]|uniref:Uncharacterized protein n=1 Tax=Chaetomium tenue TaxID=1854479 RepID=A0ACB7NY50_9PEZI|nr:hypothetical protein F5144DRAFT_356763 [Chaetomium globosum]